MSTRSSSTYVLLTAIMVALVIGVSAASARPASTGSPDQVAEALFPRLNEYWASAFQQGGIRGYRAPTHYWWYNHPGLRQWVPVSASCDSYGEQDGRMWGGTSSEYSPNSFYCPANEQVYLDYTFLVALGFQTSRKWGRGDDGRVALVIAHEFAHHVQKLLRWDAKRSGNYARYELQADCYAGVFLAWGERQGFIERGDVNQATVILGYLGDPDATPWNEPQAHGGHNDRQEWFTFGYETESSTECNRIWSS